MAESKTQTAGLLCASAARGDTAGLLALIKAGAEPNYVDPAGRTPLHIAAAEGQAEAAACLLAFGANPNATDGDGRTPFDAERTPVQTLHAIRQRYQRFQTYDEADLGARSSRLRPLAAELASRGILHLPGFVEPAALQRMQRDLGNFVGEVDALLARGEGIYHHYDEELHWAPKYQAYFSNNGFKYSPDLVELCFSSELLTFVDLYLGKPSFISRGTATHYLPMESPNGNAFVWHHDMEEKRLKALVLLTDVGDADQYMSYVVGSHALYHPYEMFLNNSCTLEYCQERLGEVEIVHTTGRAGDVFLFDSNGAHCGIRRPDGAPRSAYFVEFATSISQVWGGDLDRSLVDSLAARTGVNPFEQMLAVPKKWTLPLTRTATGWVESLPRLETWLYAHKSF